MHLGFSTPGFNSHAFATAVEPIIGSAVFTRILRAAPREHEKLFLRALYLSPIVKNPAKLNALVFRDPGKPSFEAKIIPQNLLHWSIDVQSGGVVVLRSPSSLDRNEAQIQALYFTIVKLFDLIDRAGSAGLRAAISDWLDRRIFPSSSDDTSSNIQLAVGVALLCDLAKDSPGRLQAALEVGVSRGYSLAESCAVLSTVAALNEEKNSGVKWFWSELLTDLPKRLQRDTQRTRFALAISLRGGKVGFVPGECDSVLEIVTMINRRLSELLRSGYDRDLSLKVLLGYKNGWSPLPLYPPIGAANFEIPQRFVGFTDHLRPAAVLSEVDDKIEGLGNILKIAAALRPNRHWSFRLGDSMARPFSTINFESICRAANIYSTEELADALGLSLTLRDLHDHGHDVFGRLSGVMGLVRVSGKPDADSQKVRWVIKTAKYLREVIGEEFYDPKFEMASERSGYFEFVVAAHYFAELVDAGNLGIDDTAAIGILRFGIKNQPQFNFYHRQTWREAKDFYSTDEEILARKLLRSGLLTELAKRVALPKVSLGEESYYNELGFIEEIFRAVGKDPETEAQDILRLTQQGLIDNNERSRQLEFGWSGGDGVIRVAVKRLEEHFVGCFLNGIVQGRVDPTQGVAEQYFARKLKIDNPPYAAPRSRGLVFSEQYQKCYAESVETVFSAFELYHGQGAWMFAGRRYHPNNVTQIERFGSSCARSCQVNEGRGVVFPGSGFVLSGLDLASVFPKVCLANHFSELAEMYSWARSVLLDLDRSTVGWVRGFRVVLPPENSSESSILGHTFGLISFQDHFGDLDHKGVFLVFRAAAQRVLDAYGSNSADFSGGANAVLKFIESASPADCPPLCLSWISNLGGLCNAWPPKSSPYWAWENEVRGTADFNGHIHKSYQPGGYQASWNPTTERDFASFAAAHNDIYRVAKHLFAIEKMWRVAFARFGLGHFLGSEEGEDIYTEFGNVLYPKFGSGMLAQALSWNLGLHSRAVNDIKQYPVLVLANPLDDWRAVSSDIMLDTYSLELRGLGGRRHKFSTRISDTDEAIWREWVWAKAEANGLGLRFEHRDRLGSD